MEKNEIDGRKFKRFFFFGIKDKRELVEGILYIAYKKIRRKYKDREWNEIPKIRIENEMIQEAINPYKQFCKFIKSTDNPLKKEELTLPVSIEREDFKQQLKKEIQLLKEEGKILDTNAGLFFGRERENLFDSKPQYIYGKGFQGEENWTKQVHSILEQLEELEQQDKEKYQDYLWLARFARSISRHNREEAEIIKEQMRERTRQKEAER